MKACLFFELAVLDLKVERQKPLPLVYRNHQLDCGYRLDLLVDGSIVGEVKAIVRQLNLKLGLLINFNVRWLPDGIKRIANAFPQ